MKDYISETLVHWTSREKKDDESFDNLKSIVSKQLLFLSYCPNYGTPTTVKTRDSLEDTKTMMICFTDLPLKYSNEFCSKFGKFGIGFKKSVMIEYGANPVLYTTAKHINRITEINKLKNELKSKEVDREWKEEGECYQFTSNQLYSLIEVLGFTQEYAYKDSDVNYYQREWRLNYETLPTEVGKGAEKVGHGGMHGVVNGKFMCEMKFALEDIDYIIVPKSYFKRWKEFLNIPKEKIKIYEVVVKGKWWKKFI